MELEMASAEHVQGGVDSVETVEVVTGGEELGSEHGNEGFMESHIIVTNPQELMNNSEVQIETQALTTVAQLDQMVGHTLTSLTPSGSISLSMDPTSPIATQTMLVGTKRSHPEQIDINSVMSSFVSETNQNLSSQELPRKKSRNYLDSHKNIEKKRRDRINLCLNALKQLVPDCRQYGTKKLDKAEILEMTIEFIQRIQLQGIGRGTAGLDALMNQRDWCNDLTTWVIQNKMLYSGPNALDQFCQALLLHLQTFSSQGTLSAANLLLNQTPPASTTNAVEEELKLQQQHTQQQTQSALLQQLTQLSSSPSKSQQQPPHSGGGGGGGGTPISDAAYPSVLSSMTTSNNANSAQQQQQQQSLGGGGPTQTQTQIPPQLAQTQLAQLQAILLLQQQQQVLSQQQQEAANPDGAQQLQVQLQQIQQLQSLLIQHIANEASNTATTTTTNNTSNSQSQSPTTSTTTTKQPVVSSALSPLPSSNQTAVDQPTVSASSAMAAATASMAEVIQSTATMAPVVAAPATTVDSLQVSKVASSILTPTNVTSSDLAQTVQLSLASQHVGGVVLDNASGLMGGGGGGEGGGGGGGEGGGGVPVTISSEETIYSSGLAGGLGDNLLHVSMGHSDGHSEVQVATDVIAETTGVSIEVSESGQMWSMGPAAHDSDDPHVPSAHHHHHHHHHTAGHALLMQLEEEEGGGDSVAMEKGDPQVLVSGDVQEEVELLTNQEQ